jgi:hypothetical protein
MLSSQIHLGSLSHFFRWKCPIFWDITQCSTLKFNLRSGGTCRLHLQGRAQDSALCPLLSDLFLVYLIHQHWRWRQHVPPERRLTFNVLQGVIFQRQTRFKTTSVRKSDSHFMYSCYTPCLHFTTSVLTAQIMSPSNQQHFFCPVRVTHRNVLCDKCPYYLQCINGNLYSRFYNQVKGNLSLEQALEQEPSHLLHARFLLGTFSTLKMGVIRSSETWIHIRTTRRYIPEDDNIQL